MTGRVPKVNLLRPEFAIVIGYELMVLLFKRFFLGGYEKPLKLEWTNVISVMLSSILF